MEGPWMRMLRRVLVGGLLLGAFTSSAQVTRTYYDEPRLAAMRLNLERYDWAREERVRILTIADRWLAVEDDRLRTLVPPPKVPRAIVAHTTGAPVQGDALNRKGRYSWIVDFDKPWKITSIGWCTNPDLYQRLWQRCYPMTKIKSMPRTATCY